MQEYKAKILVQIRRSLDAKDAKKRKGR